MLRAALTLFSSLQVGARIKDAIQRTLRQAIFAAVAGVVLFAAVTFGLVAAYHALILYGFSSLESAALVAASLLALGLLILALLPWIGRKKKTEVASGLPSPAAGLNAVDHQLGKAMNQVGPLTLLAIAFIAGVLASRR